MDLRCFTAVAGGLILITGAVRANVQLPPLFSAHAVLQKAAAVPVWGHGSPGEKVTVSIAGISESATANSAGKWTATLDLSKEGPGPYDLVVAGTNRIVVPDVLIGEVWICSGQSNMEFQLKRAIGAEDEIARSADTQLRQFHVADRASPDPQDEVRGSWVIAGPETSGDFSAVGYYFGRQLRKTLHAPVGLIHTSWGGTPSEAWTSMEALATVPDLGSASEKLRTEFASNAKALDTFEQSLQDWEKQNGRLDRAKADPASFASPGLSSAGWTSIRLPGPIRGVGLPESGGAVWLRRTVPLTAAMAKILPPVELGTMEGLDQDYWNGKKVVDSGVGGGAALGERRYYFPSDMTQAGDATLAIRIFNPGSFASLTGKLRIGDVDISGDWLAKAEFSLPALDPGVENLYSSHPVRSGWAQNMPSYLFNGMLRPLIPYAMRGVVWYQGESNVGRAFQYRSAFPLLIRDWRSQWNAGHFPFYFCQLANFGKPPEQPGESMWAELREAQHLALSEPNTGEAILIDIGEVGSVHPRDKKSVGERLARVALANTYGVHLPYSGPVFDSMKVEGDKIRLTFRHVEGGLGRTPLAGEIPASLARSNHSPPGP